MFRRSILSCALNSKRKQIKLFLFCLVTLLNFSLKFLNCCSWNGWNFTSLCGFFHFFLCYNNNPKPNRRVEMICLPKPLPTSKDGKRQSSWGCGKKSLLCFILAKKKKKKVAGGFYDSGINYICLGFLRQKLISAVSHQKLDTITYL